MKIRPNTIFFEGVRYLGNLKAIFLRIVINNLNKVVFEFIYVGNILSMY